MYRVAILFLFVTVCACSTDATRIDPYRYAAYSWTDGNINDMIEVWGEPRALDFQEATDDEPGYAVWRAFSRTGGGGQGGDGGIRYHCVMRAHFDTTGTISEVDIRRSDSCHRHYKDLDTRIRPGVKPLPSGGSG